MKIEIRSCRTIQLQSLPLDPIDFFSLPPPFSRRFLTRPILSRRDLKCVPKCQCLSPELF